MRSAPSNASASVVRTSAVLRPEHGFGAVIRCEQGETRRRKQHHADFSHARNEAKREMNDEYWGKRSEVGDYARDENYEL